MPVVLKGGVELQKGLRMLAPDLMKELRVELTPLLRSVTGVAKANVPAIMGYELRNFNDPGYQRESRTSRTNPFPSYDATEIRKGLTYSIGASRKNNSGYVSLVRLLNKSRPGAIIEIAGRKNLRGSDKSNSNNRNAGAHFINQLNEQVGGIKQYGKTQDSRGRLLFAAWAENQARVMPLVLAAFDKAARKFKSRLDLAA